MKTEYKVMTPENAREEIKKKEIINWIVFFGILLAVTIGVLEIITRSAT